MNEDIRKSLIEKYLHAESDIAQERLLARWFTTHQAQKDEETVARLILAEYPQAAYDAAEKEYDSLVISRTKHIRILRWSYGMAACLAIAIGLGVFLSNRSVCGFNGLEMAQGIEQIMSLDMETVTSISARPKGCKVILTAVMDDGSKCSYIMSRKKGSSAISITAID